MSDLLTIIKDASLLQHFVNGISLGSLYALVAIGYTMVYGILRLINFAHGDIFMMGTYFAFFGIVTFRLPWPVAFLVAVVVTALLGMMIERAAYKPLRDAPKNSLLISAIGVSFLLENLAIYLFSGKPKAFPEIPLFTGTVSFAGAKIQFISFFIPSVTLIFLAVLLYLINNTKMGMAMRAVSKDYETAMVMGIDTNRIISTTFIIGSTLAAVGAIMWGIRYTQIQPMMGVMPGLKCFVAAVVGGIGNIKGAVVGGFILGLGEVLLIAAFRNMTGYRDAFAFILLIVILLFRPRGILGEKITEKV